MLSTQTTKSWLHLSKVAGFVSAIILISTIVVWSYAAKKYRLQLADEHKNEYETRLSQVVTSFSALLHAKELDIAEILVINDLNNSNDSFINSYEFITLNTLNEDPTIQSLYILTGNNEELFYPETSNKALLKQTILQIDRLPQASQGIGGKNNGSSTSFYLTLPIYVIKSNLLIIKQKAYRDEMVSGEAVVFFDLQKLLELSGVSAFSNNALTAFIDPKGSVIWGDPDITNKDPVSVPLPFQNEGWRIASVPLSGWDSGFRTELYYFWFGGILLAGLLATITYILISLQTYFFNPPGLIGPDASSIGLLERHLQKANIGYFEYQVRRNRIYLSPTWKKQLGYLPEEIKDDLVTWESLLHPEDSEQAIKKINTAINHAQPNYENIFRLRHKDGSYRWILAMAGLEADNRGNTFLVAGFHIDITELKHLEEEVTNQQKQNQELIDRSNLAIGLLYLDGRLDYINPAGKSLFGLNTADYHGNHLGNNCMGENFANSLSDHLTEIQSSKTVSHWIAECEKTSGKIFLDVTLSPKLSEQGVVCGAFLFANDISDYFKEISETKSKAEFFNQLAENLDEVLWVLDAETLRFSYVSPYVEKQNGFTVAELTNHSFESFIPAIEYEGFIQRLNQLVDNYRSGIHLPQDMFTVENQQLRKGGSKFWTQSRMRLSTDRLTGHVEIIGVTRDIDEQRITQNAIIEREKRLESALAGANDGIWDISLDSEEVYLNNRVCEILGYKPEESDVLAAEWCSLINLKEIYRNFYNSGLNPNLKQVFEIEMQLSKFSSGKIWVLLRGKIVDNDTHGNPIRVSGTITDISKRKSFEQQALESQEKTRTLLAEADKFRRVLLSVIEDQKLAEERIRGLNSELELRIEERTNQLITANNELEAFAYSVSHDLRAPLRAIDGFSNALLDDWNDKLDKPGKQYLSNIIESTHNMAQLINDLMDLSRVTKVEFNTTHVSLSDLATQILTKYNRENPENNVSFTVAPNISVIADNHLLRIALENLLTNAIKFTSHVPHPYIEVGCDLVNQHPVFFVKDNGVGFDETHAEKLFSPFQRLHDSEEYPGTGIGLATVHRIITRHGGKIWAKSKVNEGATFFFTFGHRSTSKNP